jgi:hypothetical protein
MLRRREAIMPDIPHLWHYTRNSGHVAETMAVCCWRADREADAWAQFCEIAEIGADA